MYKNVGINDQCPCGSGKKYKKCCFNNDSSNDMKANFKTTFRFEPGSYGSVGNFRPSIACLKLGEDGEWIYYYVLVKVNEVFAKEDIATQQANIDCSEAFKMSNDENKEMKVAMSLKEAGYSRIDNFKIIGNS